MQKLDAWMERRFQKILAAILIVAAALYAVFALKSHVWADEAYSFALIRHSYAGIWKITAADSHPPLFYFLMKTLTAPFGYNLYAARLAASIPCLAVIALGGIQLRKFFGTRTAVFFMVLYTFYPFLMPYATEVRMYSIAELGIMVNAIFAYRCWKWNKKRDWAIFAVGGLTAAYSHYFALVSAALIYGLLFILALCKKRSLLKNWLFASIATILVYLPWLGNLISQLVFKANNVYWIAPITPFTIVSYVLDVFSADAMLLYPLFLGSAYLVAFISVMASRDRESIGLSLCALAIPLGTIAVGVIASLLLRPVFVIRYAVPALPLIVLFFAYALGKMKNEMLISSLLTVALIGGINNATTTAKLAVIPKSDRISAAQVAQYPEYEAFVVMSGNSLHASQELCYCDPETPVYTSELLGPDNPYPNRVDLATFSAEDYDKIILVLKEGAEVPEAFLQHYNASFMYTVSVSGTNESLWHLTK